MAADPGSMLENTTSTVIVSNVPVPLLEAFKRISDAHDHSLSQEIRWAMREYVAEHDRMLVDAGLPPLMKEAD
jgi:hypothetical protein